MNRSAVIRITVTTVILVVVMWLVFRSVDVDVLAADIVDASWWLLLACVPVILLSHVVRARRWKRLLAHLPETGTVSDGFAAIMIGYAANTLIPRSGELLRPFVLSRRSSIPFSTALSSVVVERVIDLITLLLGIATLVFFQADVVSAALPGVAHSTILLTLVVPLIALATAIIIIAFTDLGPRVNNALVGRVSKRAAEAVNKILADVKVGAGALSNPSSWPGVLVDSAVMWTLYAIPLWLTLEAMPWGLSGFDLLDAATLLVVIAIGVTVAPTPGAMGVYQGFAQVAMMRLYGATATEGLAFGVLAWIVNYGVALVVGGIYFILEMRKGLRWRDAERRATHTESDAS